MTDKFNDIVKRRLYSATTIANERNYKYVDTDHLLAAILDIDLEDNGLVDILTYFDISAGSLYDVLITHMNKSTSAISNNIQLPLHANNIQLPLHARLKVVLEYAVDESNNMGHDYIGTKHILLGVLREGSGFAAKTLFDLGLNIEDCRQVVKFPNSQEMIETKAISKNASYRVKIKYKTRAEAEAFVQGIEYVGDICVQVLKIKKDKKGKFAVLIENFDCEPNCKIIS